MPVILINPNSTETMTEAMVDAARRAAPSLSFEGWTSHDGPPAIQGAEDGERATHPLLALAAKAAGLNPEGIIIGCFDDTALDRVASVAGCPVIGIGQAAFHFCAMRGWRFSVVTTLDVSVPVIEANLASYGLAGHVARVRASAVPVLALEADAPASTDAVRSEARVALTEDGIDALVLGCAGMVTLTERLQAELSVPTIDPVVAAATAMLWLTAFGPSDGGQRLASASPQRSEVYGIGGRADS